MILLPTNWASEVQVVVTALLLILVYVYRRHTRYWTDLGIPNFTPFPIIGSLSDLVLQKLSPGDFFRKYYNMADTKVLGLFIFHKPGLLIRCPDLIKQILVKDFNYFANRYVASNERDDPLGTNNLFMIKSPNWKEMRQKLTPIFTSGKIKKMFYLMNEVGEELEKYISKTKSEKEGGEVHDIRELCAKYTTDVIATCAYGIKANCLSDPDAEFRRVGRKIFEVKWFRMIELTSFFFLPQIVSFFKFKFFNEVGTKFIKEATMDTIKSRESSGIKRNDLIDILIKLKNSPYSGSGLKFEGDTLVAQTAIFFTAGFETSSSTMSFALYELALQPNLQERLRQEIRKTIKDNNGEITYDIIMGMTYLDMVISETLRKYPTLPFLDRECTSSTGFPLPAPYENAILQPGTPVFIPIGAIQMDPKYYPDPDRFDPERFTEEAKQARNPYCYLPFGTGPHACIGERFGLLQTKVGLIYILRDYGVKVCSKTPVPMVFDPLALLMTPKGGLLLNIEKVN